MIDFDSIPGAVGDETTGQPNRVSPLYQPSETNADLVAELDRLREQNRSLLAERAQREDERRGSVLELKPHWTSEPPTQQGYYWHWDGDTENAPFMLSTLYSGTAKACFVSLSNPGVETVKYCKDLGGYWCEALPPEWGPDWTYRPTTCPLCHTMHAHAEMAECDVVGEDRQEMVCWNCVDDIERRGASGNERK